jgi:hypothetical protein
VSLFANSALQLKQTCRRVKAFNSRIAEITMNIEFNANFRSGNQREKVVLRQGSGRHHHHHHQEHPTKSAVPELEGSTHGGSLPFSLPYHLRQRFPNSSNRHFASDLRSPNPNFRLETDCSTSSAFPGLHHSTHKSEIFNHQWTNTTTNTSSSSSSASTSPHDYITLYGH